jgi:hypothetical protein
MRIEVTVQPMGVPRILCDLREPGEQESPCSEPKGRPLREGDMTLKDRLRSPFFNLLQDVIGPYF